MNLIMAIVVIVAYIVGSSYKDMERHSRHLEDDKLDRQHTDNETR